MKEDLQYINDGASETPAVPEFDFCVAGTGFTECFVAASLAMRGYKVLQLDKSSIYGGPWQTHTLAGLQEWCASIGSSQNDSQHSEGLATIESGSFSATGADNVQMVGAARSSPHDGADALSSGCFDLLHPISLLEFILMAERSSTAPKSAALPVTGPESSVISGPGGVTARFSGSHISCTHFAFNSHFSTTLAESSVATVTAAAVEPAGRSAAEAVDPTASSMEPSDVVRFDALQSQGVAETDASSCRGGPCDSESVDAVAIADDVETLNSTDSEPERPGTAPMLEHIGTMEHLQMESGQSRTNERCPKPSGTGAVATISRYYNIDCTPRLILSSSELLAPLLNYGVARYLEFRFVDGPFILMPNLTAPDAPQLRCDEELSLDGRDSRRTERARSSFARSYANPMEGRTQQPAAASPRGEQLQFELAPLSKGAICENKQLSLVDKRVLMKCVGFLAGGAGEIRGAAISTGSATTGLGRFFSPASMFAMKSNTVAGTSEALDRNSSRIPTLPRSLFERLVYGACLHTTDISDSLGIHESTLPYHKNLSQELDWLPSPYGEVYDHGNAIIPFAEPLLQTAAAFGVHSPAGAFIYPMFGTSDIPQGFARCCAVHGGEFRLRSAIHRVVLERAPITPVHSTAATTSLETPEVSAFLQRAEIAPPGGVEVSQKVLSDVSSRLHPLDSGDPATARAQELGPANAQGIEGLGSVQVAMALDCPSDTKPPLSAPETTPATSGPVATKIPQLQAPVVDSKENKTCDVTEQFADVPVPRPELPSIPAHGWILRGLELSNGQYVAVKRLVVSPDFLLDLNYSSTASEFCRSDNCLETCPDNTQGDQACNTSVIRLLACVRRRVIPAAPSCAVASVVVPGTNPVQILQLDSATGCCRSGEFLVYLSQVQSFSTAASDNQTSAPAGNLSSFSPETILGNEVPFLYRDLFQLLQRLLMNVDGSLSDIFFTACWTATSRSCFSKPRMLFEGQLIVTCDPPCNSLYSIESDVKIAFTVLESVLPSHGSSSLQL